MSVPPTTDRLTLYVFFEKKHIYIYTFPLRPPITLAPTPICQTHLTLSNACTLGQNYSGEGWPYQSFTNDRSHGVISSNPFTDNMFAPQTFSWGRQTRERCSVICIREETKMNYLGKKMIPQQGYKRESHPSLRSMKVTNQTLLHIKSKYTYIDRNEHTWYIYKYIYIKKHCKYKHVTNVYIYICKYFLYIWKHM